MSENNPKLLLFAKEKPGFNEIVEFLRLYSGDISIYPGQRTDPFPEETFIQSPDFVISYLSPWIIPGRLLKNVRKWAVNFHPGSPEYPGTGCTNFALYNGENTYGVTAHLMEPTVDTGRILAVKRFPILDEDTVYSLTQRAYEHLQIVFKEVMSEILGQDRLPVSDETWTRKPYLRRQLNELCRITPSMDDDEINRRVRATTYPGMPGPYVNLGDHRFIYQGADHE